jgi:hypothetical protein
MVPLTKAHLLTALRPITMIVYGAINHFLLDNDPTTPLKVFSVEPFPGWIQPPTME